MPDRRQIADELWAAFKDRWTGERKYALRAIRKHLLGTERNMSSWRYQIMQHVDDSGEKYLAVHEFYVMHDGKEGWTQKAVLIEADNLDSMRMALINILQDLERHGIRDAKTGAVVQTGSVGQM